MKIDNFRTRKPSRTQLELIRDFESQYREGSTVKWVFNSLNEFLDGIPSIYVTPIDNWINEGKQGNTDIVPHALAMLDKLSTAICNNVRIPCLAISGGVPNIGAFLSNDPECFHARRNETLNEETKPIRIFYSVVRTESSDVMLERGIAALALCLEMSKTRDVEFWTFNHGGSKGGNYFTVAIKAQNPFCLSELCYVLTSETYAFKLVYGLERFEMGGLSVTPREYRRGALGATNDDLILDHTFCEDNAIEWIQRHLDEHNERKRF